MAEHLAALDKLKAQLPVANEERLFTRSPLDPKLYGPALGRLRRVHTSAALVLARMEAHPEQQELSLCALVAEPLAEARAKLRAAGKALASLVPTGEHGWAAPSPDAVAAALLELDAAVNELETQARQIQPDAFGEEATAAHFLALGNVVFLFIDANVQYKAAALDICPALKDALAARAPKAGGARGMMRLASTMVPGDLGGHKKTAAFKAKPLVVQKARPVSRFPGLSARFCSQRRCRSLIERPPLSPPLRLPPPPAPPAPIRRRRSTQRPQLGAP